MVADNIRSNAEYGCPYSDADVTLKNAVQSALRKWHHDISISGSTSIVSGMS